MRLQTYTDFDLKSQIVHLCVPKGDYFKKWIHLIYILIQLPIPDGFFIVKFLHMYT